MKKTSSIVTRIAILSGLALGAFTLSALATWTNAPANPPQNNVAAPINVGGGDGDPATWYPQTKTGALTLTGFLTLSNLIFDPAGPGSVTPGDVLTADTADGVVNWATPATGGASGGKWVVFRSGSEDTNNTTVCTIPSTLPGVTNPMCPMDAQNGVDGVEYLGTGQYRIHFESTPMSSGVYPISGAARNYNIADPNGNGRIIVVGFDSTNGTFQTASHVDIQSSIVDSNNGQFSDAQRISVMIGR